MKVFLLALGVVSSFRGSWRLHGTPGRMAPVEKEVGKNDAVRELLGRVSDHLANAEEESAVRVLAARVDELVACDLARVAADFDSPTRELALSYAEEFSSHATALEGRRKRLLLEIVDAVKLAPPNTLDAIFAELRPRIIETGVLELVDAEVARFDPSSELGAFITAVRDRLRVEVAAATYGDDALSLHRILEAPDDGARGAALADELRRRTSAGRDALVAALGQTRDDVAQRTDPPPDLLSTLDSLIAVAQGMVVVGRTNGPS